MKEKYRCQKCRKIVTPIAGRLVCCGHSEDVHEVRKNIAASRRRTYRKLDRTLFPEPVITHYGDDPDDDIHEGIPNT